jgi:hypothetical protein
MKMGDFAWHKRKVSPYLARNELHSEYNRKISAYFTLAGYYSIPIKFNEVLITVLAYKLFLFGRIKTVLLFKHPKNSMLKVLTPES